jgi:hypothetical protein
MFCWPCIRVYQYNETNVMHFSFNLLRTKGLYMFETCRGLWFSINWMKSASRWFHYTDHVLCWFCAARFRKCSIFYDMLHTTGRSDTGNVWALMSALSSVHLKAACICKLRVSYDFIFVVDVLIVWLQLLKWRCYSRMLSCVPAAAVCVTQTREFQFRTWWPIILVFTLWYQSQQEIIIFYLSA